jgi:hypothetical protein
MPTLSADTTTGQFVGALGKVSYRFQLHFICRSEEPGFQNEGEAAF